MLQNKLIVAFVFSVPGIAFGQSLADSPNALENRSGWVEVNALRTPGTAGASRWNYLFDAARSRRDLDANPSPARSDIATQTSPGSVYRTPSDSMHRRLRINPVPSPRDEAVYNRTFRILMAHPDLTDRYDELIEAAAERFDLDPRLLKAIIAAESEFARNAVSPSGALGLMQVMPRTSVEMGVPESRLLDPNANIAAGAAYLHELFRMAWRTYRLSIPSFRQAPEWIVRRVIASYNAGPRFLVRRPWYAQTRAYVWKVSLFYRSPVADVRAQTKNQPMFPPYMLVPDKG